MEHPERKELTMYTRVTVGLDGSRLAEAALVPAAALAQKHGAAVRIVSVAPKQRDEAALRRYHLALHDDGVLDDGSVCEVLAAPPGRATATVLHEALAGPDDILCLATRGHSGVGNILLGSVAEGVLSRHTDPVLMVGPGFRTEEPVSFQTLLLCLDGSQQSEAMLPHAAAWAEALKMSIRILHVASPPPPRTPRSRPGANTTPRNATRRHGSELRRTSRR
jgi:nucleotide-binding universal stress UspA family protein